MTDAAPAPVAAPVAEAPATLVGSATAPVEGAPDAPPAPAPSGPEALYGSEAAPQPEPAAVDTSTPEAKPADGEAPPEPVTYTAESYKDLKFREGMSPSEARLASFTELAAKAGLTPENAQALVDLQQDIATEQAEAFRAAQEADFAKVQGEWRGEAMKLPWVAENTQLDATKPNYNPGMAAIGQLFDEFDKTGAFRSMLNQTGVGNHPATLQFMYDVVQTLVEGAPITTPRPIPSGPNGRARGTSPADILHPES